MTVLCWDLKALAADKQATNGDALSKVTKIFRFHDELIGLFGTIGNAMVIKQWYESGAIVNEWPKEFVDEATEIIVVRADKTVWEYGSPIPFRVHGKCAFGGGQETAMALLNAGHSARDTVKRVCAVNNACGMGIDVLTLKGTKGKK